jgi:hypothetical protein
MKFLLREHANAHSLLRKAQIEDRIWNLVLPAERRPYKSKPRYLAHALGGAINQYAQRAYLLKAKGNTELWRRVDHEGMLATTAVRLHREARVLEKRRKIPFIDALMTVLGEYDSLPKRGKTRARNPSKLSRVKDRQVQQARKRAKQVRENGDTFWKELRESIREYVVAHLPDGEVVDIDPVWRALETDLKVVIEDFQSRLSRLRREQRETLEPIKRSRLRDACQTLHLDPPTKTKPLDMARVRKQKRVLARAYHPDAHGGDDSMRAQYNAVLDAYHVIEQWHHETQESEAK